MAQPLQPADPNQPLAAFAAEWLSAIASEKAANVEKEDAKSWGSHLSLVRTTWLLGFFQLFLIILFATVGGDEELDPATAPGTGTQGYNMFIGVEIMMFIGFGYLMTFLKWYGLGAVGFTMLVTAIGLQWAVFTESFFHQWYETNGREFHDVEFSIYSLLNALYAISAVLITFGGLIGKINPFQLMVLTIIELMLHSFHYVVLMTGVMNLADVGGTYSDHMFGAYFGLSVAFVLGKPHREPVMGNTNDIFSLVGTLFLWVYWPSFVAGAAPADSGAQQRAIVNTILALASCTVAAFFCSILMSKHAKFRPVDIQNATLAGGVAIGAIANLHVSPFDAVMVGITAGIVSTFGFNHIQPFLEEKIGLHDSCGIHNLHAMPSVIGGLASVFLAAYKQDNGHHDYAIYNKSATGQWWHQLVAMILCMSFAISTGLVVGCLLKFLETERLEKTFHDDQYWEVADDYGRSIYTELAHVIKSVPGATTDAQMDAMEKEIEEWSAHAGRRKRAHSNASSAVGEINNSFHGGYNPSQTGGLIRFPAAAPVQSTSKSQQQSQQRYREEEDGTYAAPPNGRNGGYAPAPQQASRQQSRRDDDEGRLPALMPLHTTSGSEKARRSSPVKQSKYKEEEPLYAPPSFNSDRDESDHRESRPAPPSRQQSRSKQADDRDRERERERERDSRDRQPPSASRYLREDSLQSSLAAESRDTPAPRGPSRQSSQQAQQDFYQQGSAPRDQREQREPPREAASRSAPPSANRTREEPAERPPRREQRDTRDREFQEQQGSPQYQPQQQQQLPRQQSQQAQAQKKQSQSALRGSGDSDSQDEVVARKTASPSRAQESRTVVETRSFEPRSVNGSGSGSGKHTSPVNGSAAPVSSPAPAATPAAAEGDAEAAALELEERKALIKLMSVLSAKLEK